MPIARNALFAALTLTALSATAQAADTVNVSRFTSVELKGGGHVLLRHGAVQRVTILKGSTQYTRFESEQSGRQLKIRACDENCPHNYDLEIEIVTPDISGIAVSGGGAIEAASGFPAQNALDAAVSGGGELDLRAISAGSANAAVDGGGSIKLRASGRLMAAVDGGGEVIYWGSPKVTSVVNGGGDISKGG